MVGEKGAVGPEGSEEGGEGIGNGEGRIACMAVAGSIAANGCRTDAEME